MKKTVFRQPGARTLPAEAESWVKEAANPEALPTENKPATAEKPARLTIDLPPELHATFKAACAKHRTRMVEEVRGLIEEWTQKHA